MKIFLRELTDQETQLSFNQDEPWVAEAVARVDERLENEVFARPGLKTRSIETRLSLRKVDEVIVLTGDLKTHIELICSRCANPFQFNCHPKLSALFCTDPVMAGISHLQKEPGKSREPGKPMGQNQGHARHAHDYEADAAIESGQDLDITYLSNDYIDLKDVLTEQLQLQIPFQPLCKESCKGICANCGADLNVGRCACAKLTTTQPFSVLKDLKV